MDFNRFTDFTDFILSSQISTVSPDFSDFNRFTDFTDFMHFIPRGWCEIRET
jgi:hypothetical protein